MTGEIKGFFLRKKIREAAFPVEKLKDRMRGRVLLQEPLARYTTFRVGGKADALVFPADADDLGELLSFAEAEKIPVFVLGGGSNLLVRDGGIRGITLCLREGLRASEEITPSDEEREEATNLPGGSGEEMVFYRVQAGASLPRLIRFAANHGLSGLEGLAGVVGSVGGALAMNSGTRHGQMGDSVISLTVINRQGVQRIFPRSRLKFHYREVEIDRSWYFLESVIGFRRREPAAIKATIKGHLDYRQKTQPLDFPNAGSIFKNPPHASAGEIIERVGLKGVRLRGAKISELHANWIVNLGHATAQDIFQLIQLVKDKVKEKEGIALETEVKIVGENRKE